MRLSRTKINKKRIIILLCILVGIVAIYKIWDSDYGYVYRNYFFRSNDELLLDFNRLEPINIVDTKKNLKINWFCRKEQTQFGDFWCGDRLSKWNDIPAMTVVFWYRNGILTYAKIDIPPWHHDELIKYFNATYGPPHAYSARKNLENILSGTYAMLRGDKGRDLDKEIRDLGIWQMDTGAFLVVNIKKEFNPLLWSTVFWISPAMFSNAVTSSEQRFSSLEFPPPAAKLDPGERAGCSCGTLQFHTGTDWSAKEGTAVPVADDGVVIRVEENEVAIVYSPTGGYCGRYVVVRHDYPNGRAVYTRYAQLGRLVSNNGEPIRVGTKVKKQDKIGEVGKFGLFHFEVRPVDSKTIDTGIWTKMGTWDETMEWAKYPPVNPNTFDFDEFAKGKWKGQP